MEKTEEGKLEKIDFAYWLSIVLYVIAFIIGLMAGDFGAGAIPYMIWVVLACAVAWKLNEHIHKAVDAIERTYSIKMKIELARKAQLKFNLVATAFSFGLAAVALTNYIFRVHIHANPEADLIFYYAAITFFSFAYLGGMFYTSELLHKAVGIR
jgi:ABC-type polysaccharide/polyol phosphate export permease